MIDYTPQSELEQEAKDQGLRYINLNGKIACIVNDTGLGMATLDMISYYSAYPANSLSLSASFSKEKFVAALDILAKDKNVEVIFINLFITPDFGDNYLIVKAIQKTLSEYYSSGHLCPEKVFIRLSDISTEGNFSSNYLSISDLFNVTEDMEDAVRQVCEYLRLN